MTRRAPAALVVGALALLALGPGCVTIAQVSTGNTIDLDAVAAVEAGRTTLPGVLALLGAPLEVHNHADGRLLIYRHGARNTFRLGINPSRAISYLDLSQVASEALGNLKFNLERIHSDEDRVVILLDRDDVVRAVGLREGTRDLSVF